MALKYLLGSDVESTESMRLSRLLGISHESYENYCINALNNPNYDNRTTKYCFGIVENDGEYALEMDDEQEEFPYLPSVHENRLVSRSTMESNGWFQE